MEATIAALVSRSTASGWLLCILAIGGVIQLSRIVALQRPKMKELETQAEESERNAAAQKEESLRDTLLVRVERVEEQLDRERSGRADDRRELENKMERQRELYETKLEVERARHEAAEMLSRHKVRNLEACLSAFLWMAEKRPDNIPEVVAEVRKMRAEQELAEAAEKGAVAGAKIIATGTKPD
ncbi:hypothetical protein H5J25_13895 [Sphingomonas aliaeris]|uniref:Uncharacterized protein n=1 Tax=Sphingomonas aliaeris TaxID=2759526 RepID=A0A974NT74_9SPHN|nr:hypothetical protein [Sphingomonas aliaeris]QQV76535.1 hypothetical protein H5J25_13895 [Sphingomonas aliaeris]